MNKPDMGIELTASIRRFLKVYFAICNNRLILNSKEKTLWDEDLP